MKVLLTTLNSKYVHTNLAIRYLYFTINKKCDVSLKEFTINEEMFRILAGINRENADLIAFSCYIWNIDYILEICSAIKKVKPETMIVLGGPEVSYHADQLLSKNRYIDFIIQGEGEIVFPKLIQDVIQGTNSFESFESIAYRDEQGKVHIGDRNALVEDLSLVPSPFTVDLSEYDQKVVYYESSRGCPYNCSYCLSSTTRGVRYFPLERVKADLKRLIDAKVKQIKFVDRTFNCNRNRAMEIWRYLLENLEDTTFHFEISGHLMDDEMLELLQKVPGGYFDFEIGVQTTCEEALCAINRRTDFIKLSEVVRRLRDKNNIHLHLDLIAGLPYETYSSFRQSFDDVYNLKPHLLQLGFLKLLRGSRIREEEDVHHYKFLDRPPYEVLENRYISFELLIRLKRVEEIIEIYKNSGRFENCTEFVINNFYESPFKFFEELANYWEANLYFERKIGTEETYDILADFYMNKTWRKLDCFHEILKLDYILNNIGAARRPWQKTLTVEKRKEMIQNILSEPDFIEKYAPGYTGLSHGEIVKKVHFEIFSCNVTGNLGSQPILVMFLRVDKKWGKSKAAYVRIESQYFKPENVIETM